jgi:hypothetical protein
MAAPIILPSAGRSGWRSATIYYIARATTVHLIGITLD